MSSIDDARREALLDIFSCMDNIFYWNFDPDMNLMHTNCPDDEFFYGILRISDCAALVKEHFQKEHYPVFASDELGISWICAGEFIDGTLHSISAVGPVLTSDLSMNQLNAQMAQLNLSVQAEIRMADRFRLIPVVLYTSCLRYGVMLHFFLNHERLTTADVLPCAKKEKALDENFPTECESAHGTWEFEQQLMQAVRNGDLSAFQRIRTLSFNGQPGRMCPGNPLRQKKDEMIILGTLCTRAAIEGGMNPEISYTLCDYYIQSIETATTIDMVVSYGGEIIRDYTTRVRKIKQSSMFSKPIVDCIDYIDFHIEQKITLKMLAAHVSYSESHLSTLFKKETGVSLQDYIAQQKIERSKILLKSTDKTIAEISSRLAFSSPSYFCAQFKRLTGRSPNAYREEK